MVRSAVSRWQGLDILHNNVGVGMSRGTVVDSDLDQWDAVQQINVRSMVLTARAAVPAMAASGGGAIVNVSSIAALRPRGMTAYSTSKATAIALSQSMAVDHAVDGIRVNCIAPGPIYTPMVYARGMPDSLRTARREDRMDGSRPGRPVSVIVPSADWERKPEPDMDGFGGIERGGGENGVRGA